MTEHTFTASFLFSGLGAGALGFLEACARLGNAWGKFKNLGGIDIDPLACQDFEYLTGGKATCSDVATMTPRELRAAWGDKAPDCVFLSPPCKGFSGLLSKKAAEAPKYQALNKLVLQGIWLVLETWPTPPALLVLENVPRITTRGAELLAQVRQLLTGYGYLLHEANHDCGEIGGLAQHRRRYLLIARLPAKVPAFIYKPPRKRVRACGEVLGTLPLPEDPNAGELHKLPKLSWLNWVRLALIPAGGDWRDLPGVHPELSSPVQPGQKRRAHWARYDVRHWNEAARTVAGAGSNGGFGVADPRLRCTPRAGAYGVLSWEEAAATITGNARVDNGTFAVADPRKVFAAAPVIIAQDGTWHRPLTTLELAALQGLPAEVDGKPLTLAGRSVAKHRERVGNAVPVGAAKAIAESLLTALLAARLGTWTLGSTGIWVRKEEHGQLREGGALCR